MKKFEFVESSIVFMLDKSISFTQAVNYTDLVKNHIIGNEWKVDGKKSGIFSDHDAFTVIEKEKDNLSLRASYNKGIISSSSKNTIDSDIIPKKTKLLLKFILSSLKGDVETSAVGVNFEVEIKTDEPISFFKKEFLSAASQKISKNSKFSDISLQLQSYKEAVVNFKISAEKDGYLKIMANFHTDINSNIDIETPINNYLDYKNHFINICNELLGGNNV